MDVLYPRCAGLDVHKDSVVAAVRLAVAGVVKTEVRTFDTTTPGLLTLSGWLAEHGCTHVAMEATGVYWKPVWHILSDGDVTLILANAAHVKNVPGRKTDVADAVWLSECGRRLTAHWPALRSSLLAHGLIRASFVPELHTVADRFPVAGAASIQLPARLPERGKPGRAKRTARLSIRFGEVEIVRPANEKDRTLVKTVRLRLVDVREVDAPEAVEPLHWQLLTTHEVTDGAKAWQVVDWYRARWIIEQLFRVVKSQGFGLEESQINTAERLMKLTAVAMKAACIDMQLVQERDGVHGLTAITVFTDPEIATIEALNPTLEGRTDRQRNPHPVGSLARACWVIARLGGWNCYGRPPGPITFHRGQEKFKAIHHGYILGSTPNRDVRIP